MLLELNAEVCLMDGKNQLKSNSINGNLSEVMFKITLKICLNLTKKCFLNILNFCANFI